MLTANKEVDEVRDTYGIFYSPSPPVYALFVELLQLSECHA